MKDISTNTPTYIIVYYEIVETTSMENDNT